MSYKWILLKITNKTNDIVHIIKYLTYRFKVEVGSVVIDYIFLKQWIVWKVGKNASKYNLNLLKTKHLRNGFED